MSKNKIILIVWLHFAAILILAFIGNLYIYNIPLNLNNIIQWDTEYYLYISQHGYRFHLCEFPETAFFPLFPYLWRLFSSTALSSILLNLFIFSISIAALKKAFNILDNTLLLYIALPSCFFFVMPYTESCQFLGLTLLLIGLHKSKWKLIFFGSLIAALSRPTFTILIPAILIVIFLNLLEKENFKTQIKTIFFPFISGVGIGILIVNLIQYYNTHVWWGMIKSQECWEHGLHAFSFPIQSWAGPINSLYDGITVACTLLICAFLIFYFSKKYLFHTQHNFTFSSTTIFSLTYMAGVGLTILLFQKDSHSVNRYLFCSPFFLLLMHDINSFKPKNILAVAIPIFLLGYLFGAFVHIQQLLSYLLMIGTLMSIIYILTYNKHKSLFFILYSILTLTQIYLLMLFMQAKWIA